MEITNGPQSGVPKRANQIRKIKALPNKDINKRSPLVVSKVNIPRFGILPETNEFPNRH